MWRIRVKLKGDLRMRFDSGDKNDMAIRRDCQREIRIARSEMHFRCLEFRRRTIIAKVIRLASAFHILTKYTLLATSPGLANGASRNIAGACNAPAIAPLDCSLYSTSSSFPSTFDPLPGNLCPPIRENSFPLLMFKHAKSDVRGV